MKRLIESRTNSNCFLTLNFILQHYMTFCNARTKCTKAGVTPPSSSALFEDYQQLQAIWTHPFVLKLKTKADKRVATSDSDEDATRNSGDGLSGDDQSDDDYCDDVSKCSDSESGTDSEENGKLIHDLSIFLLK